ncbi:MAG: hypothetical protein JW882_20965 [Deltaproteobacteria bacterium]|nr:hypothetical protein [Deltaproteobacteria bacterium]
MTITEENGTTRTINIESLDETLAGTRIPVVPGQATPTMSMYSNHGMTEGGGLMLDTLAIMYPAGSSVPPGINIKSVFYRKGGRGRAQRGAQHHYERD